MGKLRYATDKKRHLICVPYSVENLHTMAQELNIKESWFRKNHYSIPPKVVKEIEKQCQIISCEEIVEIIRHPEYAKIILSPEVKGTAAPKDFFWLTQIEYNG